VTNERPLRDPDWLMPADDAPPDTSSVDPHRVEDLVNRFIASKQDALFLAPDAYYRTAGADAVDGAPTILDRLNGLKQATLDAASDDDACPTARRPSRRRHRSPRRGPARRADPPDHRRAPAPDPACRHARAQQRQARRPR
jgi:hypothetical protein